MWKTYNTRVGQGESIRVFPLSNWTELDIWQYIYQENIPIVPLYFAKDRPVVRRDGTVGDVKVIRGLRGGLNDRAIQAVRQWRFAPGRMKGVPVDVFVEVAVEFRLR